MLDVSAGLKQTSNMSQTTFLSAAYEDFLINYLYYASLG